MKTDVIIIGGGLAGLAAAITLQHGGASVLLLEKNNYLGGKMRPYQLGTHTFDYGPNTITMPHVFENIIAETGRDPKDYGITFKKLDVYTRNNFADGRHLDFTTSIEAMEEQLTALDPFAAQHYRSYILETKRLYELAEHAFLNNAFFSWKDMLSPTLTSSFLKVRPFESLAHFNTRYFKDQNVINAFHRYATYIGSSPFKTPATFALIAYLELAKGVYYVNGGNTKIADAFTQVAKETGVQIQTGTKARKIHVENKVAKAVETEAGDVIDCRHVLMNADLLHAYPELVNAEDRPTFSDQKVAHYPPSISAFVILAGLSKRLNGLLHHNVFFPKTYANEFADLFDNSTYPQQPAIYVSNSSVTDPSRSPDGDNLFILVNAPPLLSTTKTQDELERYKQFIYKQLHDRGLPIHSHLVCEKIIAPKDLQNMTGAYHGAIYGMSSNRRQEAFFKPFNKAKDIQNLFFAGGSTFPGGGSPMVVRSGYNVAKAILHHRS
ncbi:phytoene desaturase [Bacillaceae bacterium SIJ1]|uniref:phytoene desaturase family protein n=1 Tax=Litoribacterium kuwaitense TaxID=1398745 RepID=UPI0013ED3B43|nr:phytoene desaturase family protein [Litoribacterium kuwaitense]NGP44533.1 phytoene desaturase [Litoribacterium kuwaitense]